MTLRRKHVLDLDDFTADEIGAVLDTAEAMSDVLARPIKRVPALRGTTIVNCFYESSTRTRVSFELAAKNLSADVVNVTASGSSVDKGESLVDTSRTLQALGADMVVIRHRSSGAPYLVSQHIAARVINAGDGWHAHPSQALLDLFTVRRHLGDLAGLKLVIVGDILHSRVARSNLWGFTRMGADVTLCGPPTLVPHDLVAAVTGQTERQPHLARAAPASDALGGHNGVGANGRSVQPPNRPVGDHAATTADAGQPAAAVATAVTWLQAPQVATTGEPRGQVHITYDLDAALADADVVMALRLQKERQTAGLLPTLREYSQRYGLTTERLKMARRHALVMHPGPMNEGVEITPEVAQGQQSVIEEQVQNGLAVRMALLYLLAGGQVAGQSRTDGARGGAALAHQGGPVG